MSRMKSRPASVAPDSAAPGFVSIVSVSIMPSAPEFRPCPSPLRYPARVSTGRGGAPNPGAGGDQDRLAGTHYTPRPGLANNLVRGRRIRQGWAGGYVIEDAVLNPAVLD